MGNKTPSAGAQRLRIAVLNRQFCATGGGAEHYSIALVEQLAVQHEMHVFAQHIEHHWPEVTYHRVSQPLVRPRWLNQLWYASATWWATRRGFDLVHSHENTWHGQVQTVHVLPIKFNLLQGLTGWRLGLRWFKIATSPRLLAYWALERSRFSLKPGPRCIVLTSQTLMASTLQAYPACESALQVITPGVDSVPGLATPEEKMSARLVLGLPARGQCLLFVGNDYRKKGLSTLLEAFRQCPKHVYLAVVGHPGQVPIFKAQALASDLADRVFFLGSLRDVRLAYRAADVLVHPTREDTFAMVVLEAMAHGLPVLVSGARYCGIAALFTHDQEALVLDDPCDALALAAALQRVLTDADLRARLSQAALGFARQHQWTTSAGQQEAIYRQMVKVSRH